MVLVLASIIGAIAALAWVFAVYCLVRLVGLAPAGHKLSTLFDLGWWKFAAIEARIGPAAVGITKTYVRAFLVFFLCVLLIAVLSVLATMSERNEAPAAQTAAEPERINDPRVIAVRTAERLDLPPFVFHLDKTAPAAA